MINELSAGNVIVTLIILVAFLFTLFYILFISKTFTSESRH